MIFGLRALIGGALLGLLVGCTAVDAPVASSDAAYPGLSDTETLVILHTNDFHGHIAESNESAGAARIAAYFAEQRAAHKNVLILDAGDAISGTPVSTLFSGVPIYEVMSQMGYDVGLLGNHEFDHGWRQIESFKEAANFPLLASTARGPSGELLGDTPSIIVDRGAIKIGVIGVLTDKTPQMITPSGNEGTTFANVAETLRERVAQLHPQVDLVIVLSHTGHEQELHLAATVPDIDVIVGGHSHTPVESPVKVGDTLVVQAHEYGKAVGRLELAVNGHVGVALLGGGLIAGAELSAADPDVAAVVDSWEAKVAAKVDFEIARAERDILPAQLRDWMEQVLRVRTDADLAYYNRGGVRDAIRAGSVTARSLWNVEPFGNVLVTVRLTGAQVAKLLVENGDSAGLELVDDKTYLLATNSFVGAHAKRLFGSGIELRDHGELVRDLFIESIQQNGLPGH